MSTSVETTPDEAVAVDDAVGAGSAACWSVRECDWQDQLPEDVVALLAPPVIVSAETFVPAGTVATVVEAPPAVTAPAVEDSSLADSGVPAADSGVPAYSPRHAAPEEPRSRFSMPTLPRRLRRRRSAA